MGLKRPMGIKRIASYLLLILNIGITTYALILLGYEIGPAWSSAGPFYFVWCLIPNILIHFGISRFGTSRASESILLAAAAVTLALSTAVVWVFVRQGPITAFSMLVFMPFPITQMILVTPLLWLAYSKKDTSQTPD